MSKRIFSVVTWSAVAVADTTNFVNQQYQAIQGVAGQRNIVSEIQVAGQATASAPSLLVTSRDSTIGVTLTALTTNESDQPVDASSAALASPAVPFTQSTTKPQRGVAAHLINQTINLFGGIARWVAYPYEELTIYGVGASAPYGELSLSAYTGSTTGGVGSHIVYETV